MLQLEVAVWAAPAERLPAWFCPTASLATVANWQRCSRCTICMGAMALLPAPASSRWEDDRQVAMLSVGSLAGEAVEHFKHPEMLPPVQPTMHAALDGQQQVEALTEAAVRQRPPAPGKCRHTGDQGGLDCITITSACSCWALMQWAPCWACCLPAALLLHGWGE